MDEDKFLPNLDDEEAMKHWMEHKAVTRPLFAHKTPAHQKRRWRWSQLRSYEKEMALISLVVFVAILVIVVVFLLV